MDKLQAYRGKRDASRTPEPVPAEPAPAAENPDGGAFVIQEHHARRLHWDFRLERDGVLVSWALPKGVPDDPAVNHLAVHTEDHPLEYGGFEGEIPRGEYGAGVGIPVGLRPVRDAQVGAERGQGQACTAAGSPASSRCSRRAAASG